MTEVPDTGERGSQQMLRRFFHDVATPLSGVSLHLERAARLHERGENPADALATARRELDRAFDLFERGRAEILKP